MKKILSTSLLSLLLVVWAASPGICQEASDILEKMIDAQGGRKLLESIEDATFTGTMEMIQMGLSGAVTMYQKDPNKIRWDGEMMGMVFTQACDGQAAWTTNPQTGMSEEMPEKMAEYFKREAIGDDALLNPEKYGIAYTLKGKEKIEEKEYYVLEQTFSDGYKVTLYIDAQTYLTYKTKAMTLNQMGVEVEGETILSDYEKVEGMMMPHTITIYQDGEEFMTITLTEVSINTGLEDSLFKMSE